MTLKKSKDVLKIQLDTIFADLQKIDDEIRCIDQRMNNLNKEMTRTGNFSSVQLEWEELKWDKWMYSHEKEAKLLLADKKIEELEQCNTYNLT